MRLSAVIPVYNSSKIIFGTYENIKTQLEEITDDYEILFRNDGSLDDSKDILDAIARKDKKVKVFSNKNHGLGFVLRELFKAATGDFIIYLDADTYLSFNLNILPSLLKKINDGDVIIASRYRNNKIPFYRLFPSLIYRLVNRFLFGVDIDDIGSGFVIFKKKVLDGINLRSNGFDIHIELFTKIKKSGFKIIEAPVKYTHWKGGSFRVLKHGPRTLTNTLKFRLRE